MAEYIEREEIMNRLFTEYATDSKADVFELIRSIPASDVQPVNQWISVKDRLPEKEQKVLVFYKAIGEKNRIHNDVIATNWRKSNGDFIPFGDYEITHWMPLPEPPKDGDTE